MLFFLRIIQVRFWFIVKYLEKLEYRYIERTKIQLTFSLAWVYLSFYITERLLEDHEYVLATYKSMKKCSKHAGFRFVFRRDYDKYEFFHYTPVSWYSMRSMIVTFKNIDLTVGKLKTINKKDCIKFHVFYLLLVHIYIAVLCLVIHVFSQLFHQTSLT